jgi:hypothetical protein
MNEPVSEQRECGPCGVAMVEGWILDLKHSNLPRQATWVEGPPEKGWFYLRTNKKQFAVTAYRCPKCGRLDLYAIDEVE